jgi:hypothetical protein
MKELFGCSQGLKFRFEFGCDKEDMRKEGGEVQVLYRIYLAFVLRPASRANRRKPSDHHDLAGQGSRRPSYGICYPSLAFAYVRSSTSPC